METINAPGAPGSRRARRSERKRSLRQRRRREDDEEVPQGLQNVITSDASETPTNIVTSNTGDTPTRADEGHGISDILAAMQSAGHYIDRPPSYEESVNHPELTDATALSAAEIDDSARPQLLHPDSTNAHIQHTQPASPQSHRGEPSSPQMHYHEPVSSEIFYSSVASPITVQHQSAELENPLMRFRPPHFSVHTPSSSNPPSDTEPTIQEVQEVEIAGPISETISRRQVLDDSQPNTPPPVAIHDFELPISRPKTLRDTPGKVVSMTILRNEGSSSSANQGSTSNTGAYDTMPWIVVHNNENLAEWDNQDDNAPVVDVFLSGTSTPAHILQSSTEEPSIEVESLDELNERARMEIIARRYEIEIPPPNDDCGASPLQELVMWMGLKLEDITEDFLKRRLCEALERYIAEFDGPNTLNCPFWRTEWICDPEKFCYPCYEFRRLAVADDEAQNIEEHADDQDQEGAEDHEDAIYHLEKAQADQVDQLEEELLNHERFKDKTQVVNDQSNTDSFDKAHETAENDRLRTQLAEKQKELENMHTLLAQIQARVVTLEKVNAQPHNVSSAGDEMAEALDGVIFDLDITTSGRRSEEKRKIAEQRKDVEPKLLGMLLEYYKSHWELEQMKTLNIPAGGVADREYSIACVRQMRRWEEASRLGTTILGNEEWAKISRDYFAPQKPRQEKLGPGHYRFWYDKDTKGPFTDIEWQAHLLDEFGVLDDNFDESPDVSSPVAPGRVWTADRGIPPMPKFRMLPHNLPYRLKGKGSNVEPVADVASDAPDNISTTAVQSGESSRHPLRSLNDEEDE